MEFLRLDNTSIDAQVRVYHAAFNKTAPIEETKELWIKKHYKNPLENSLIFGAVEDGELVGINAYLPSRYKLNGEDIYVLQSCESGVLPSHQGRGIWGKVVKYAVEYIEKNTKYVGIIGFPNYRNSYPGFKKMGWKTLYEMNNMIMTNNAKAFAKSLFGERKLLCFLGQFSILQRLPIIIISSCYKKICVAEISIKDVIWEDHKDRIMIDHFLDWCRWKSDYKHMLSISLNLEGLPIASCIYGIDHFEGNDVIRVDYFSVKDGCLISPTILLSRMFCYFREKYPKAAFVRIWTMNGTGLNSQLKKLLFLRSSHPNPFILSEPISELANKDWTLSFFDLD